MVRSLNFSLAERKGTALPGFTHKPFLLGMDTSFTAPGWAFILGSQNINIKDKMVENNWLAKSQYLTFPFTQFVNNDLKITGNIEPFNDFRIQSINANPGAVKEVSIPKRKGLGVNPGRAVPFRSARLKLSDRTIINTLNNPFAAFISLGGTSV